MKSREDSVVLIGAAGTSTSFGVIKTLHEVWPKTVKTVAADMSPPWLVASSSIATSAVQVPPILDSSFLERMKKILKDLHVDVYFPIIEDEILLTSATEFRRQVAPHTVILAPSHESVAICRDKFRAYRWLREAGIPTPQTWTAADSKMIPLETVLTKPRFGAGSLGVQQLPLAEIEKLNLTDDFILQEICDKPEVTLDGFRSLDGAVTRVVCRERLEVKAGVCTKARVFEDEDLSKLGKAVAEGLNLTGNFCIQAMKSANAQGWKITDINPRPGAGTRLSVAAGVNLIAATFANLWGEPYHHYLNRLPNEKFVVRSYSEHVNLQS